MMGFWCKLGSGILGGLVSPVCFFGGCASERSFAMSARVRGTRFVEVVYLSKLFYRWFWPDCCC